MRDKIERERAATCGASPAQVADTLFCSFFVFCFLFFVFLTEALSRQYRIYEARITSALALTARLSLVLSLLG